MSFQSAIAASQGFGVVGELVYEGPLRAQPGIISSSDATQNIVGRAFTFATGQSAGKFTAGGAGVFAGILCNPKAYALTGTPTGGTLAPTLQLPNEAVAEFLEMGHVVILVPSACALGDEVCYATATGALLTVPPGAAAGPPNTKIPNCVIARVTPNASGAQLAVAKITL